MPSHSEILQVSSGVSGFLSKVANRALSVVVAAGTSTEGVSFAEGAVKVARAGVAWCTYAPRRWCAHNGLGSLFVLALVECVCSCVCESCECV